MTNLAYFLYHYVQRLNVIYYSTSTKIPHIHFKATSITVKWYCCLYYALYCKKYKQKQVIYMFDTFVQL